MAEPEKQAEKPKSIVEIMQENIAALTAKVEELSKRPYAKRQLFGGKTERNPVVDTKTNKVYISKSALGKTVAAEFELDPADKFVWYKIRAKAPDRFREATEDEAKKVIADFETEQAAAQAKLEAEEAAKAAEAAKKGPATPAPTGKKPTKKA